MKIAREDPIIVRIAGVAELADAPDSKSGGRKAVWVRPPPPAPEFRAAAFLNDARTKMTKKMSKQAITFDTVRKFGLALPNVEESTSFGAPALKVHGKMFCCVPTHKSAEPGSLAVRVDFEDRAEMLAAAPNVYYLKPHYVEYDAVLVRLAHIEPEVLRDLLRMAHNYMTSKRTKCSSTKKSRLTRPGK